MSLITPNKTKLDLTAEKLLTAPSRLFTLMFNDWKQNFLAIWDAENPQAVITKLGNDAEELFTLSAQMVGFLEALKPGCTTALLSKYRPVTFDEDGKGTIVEE